MTAKFIQEALLQLVKEKKADASLLVVNHQNTYLTLSNEGLHLPAALCAAEVISCLKLQITSLT